MCGIAGFMHGDATRRIDMDLLRRMNTRQAHRGPDAGTEFAEQGIALAHRRLSIIDLSNGHQPLFNEDGSVVIVYNGEIYNFPELSRILQAAGHQFRTHCDTEVIVHAWEAWGVDCVHHFRGMFAFALWDKNKRQLFLARDRMGVKPLYYAALPGNGIVFASELKSLLVHPETQRQLDPQAIEDYFAFGYVPDPKTIFKNIYKLAPGHRLLIQQGEAIRASEEYWDVSFNRVIRISEQEAQEELLSRLQEAIKIRLVSEVPLGAFLSGGVDSSAVVAMMAGLMDEAVNTCSISFGDPAYNESQYAQQIAKQYATQHFSEQVDPDDFSLVSQLAAIYDEPFADSSALPTFRVCELARKRVTVALSGDGGDENLAGYRRYRWHMNEEKIRRRLPQSLRGPLFGLLGQVYPKADWAPKMFRAKTTFQALARNSMAAYLNSVSVMSDSLRQRLYSKHFRSQLQSYSALEVFHAYRDKLPEHPLSQIQYLDFKTYLPGDILTKVDRASMANSLEVREPLLDQHLVEWWASLPPELKLNQGEGKYIFKRSLERHLPKDILYRPKMGFGVPLASWFRGPLKQALRNALLGSTLMETGIFEPKELHRLIDEHQRGLGEHSAALWSLLMFESFLKNSYGESVQPSLAGAA